MSWRNAGFWAQLVANCIAAALLTGLIEADGGTKYRMVMAIQILLANYGFQAALRAPAPTSSSSSSPPSSPPSQGA